MVLTYADDISFLTPSCLCLRRSLHIVEKAAERFGMTFNTKKVCARSICKVGVLRKALRLSFPPFVSGDFQLSFVCQFK